MNRTARPHTGAPNDTPADARRRMTTYNGTRLATLPALGRLPAALRRDIHVVSHVLPFRVNDYVVDELIDWDRVPDDPIFRLTFPHRDMLRPEDFDAIASLLDAGADPRVVRDAADAIRWRLEPHPGAQLEQNVPHVDGEPCHGLQHKYAETVLVFPAKGQTCHTYCAYCFRWAQFVGMKELRQQASDPSVLTDYVARHGEVTDVLFTGGDPMVMSTEQLERHVSPLLDPSLDHVRTIRFGTKALAYWPFRFTTDPDADALCALLERCVDHGKHVAIMVHCTHPRELETPAALAAIRRLRATGAVLRTQSPIIRHVNDDAVTWATMWNRQVGLGMVPYYMFVERDTGAHRYFALPLVEAHRVYRDAISSVSGLARTARGPSMSATPGKVVVDGPAVIQGERVLALRFLQAREPAWCNRPFFARFDPTATWLDQLRPAFGEERFFFEE